MSGPFLRPICWWRGHNWIGGYRVFGRMATWTNYCSRCDKIRDHEMPAFEDPGLDFGGLPPARQVTRAWLDRR